MYAIEVCSYTILFLVIVVPCTGEVLGAHIVILHRNMIIDTAKGCALPVREYDWRGNDLGELFAKRIFRVVPATHPAGL